jgi:serine/threonine protein kinase
VQVPQNVGQWIIGEPLGAGKSAAVFRATRNDATRAIKIFDPQIIEKYGKAVQLARVERELSLRGLHHPHLVEIIDGGECPDSGLIYVVMELIESPNLATVLADVPRERIWPILAQLADASRFLEDHQIAHRDIKPDNIAISKDFSHATLLDLGVIRPVGIAELTDETQRYFIGTLRYSPPEFLLREELDTPEGWRAVTFYQLGAVLHDLIMQRRLFSDITEPYARLVQAVERDVPAVAAADVPADLVFLARNCLQKKPDLRAQLVSWNSFEVPTIKTPRIADLKERIRQRRLPIANSLDAADAAERDQIARQKVAEVQSQIQGLIRRECVASGLFPPVRIVGLQDQAPESACTLAVFPVSAVHSLSMPLRVWVRLTILDVPSVAIQLDAWASVSNDGSETSVPDTRTIKTAFRGVNDEAVVRPVLQQLLYTALDEAQQLTARPDQAEQSDEWLALAAFEDPRNL